MAGGDQGSRIPVAMYARAVDDASVRLHELRREELQDFGLAALALGLALAATQLRPAFAMPLFLGGVAVGALAVRALWRHWDLVDRLAGERDAYVISDVLAYASRETTNERRHWFAAVIRSVVSQPGPAVASAGHLPQTISKRLPRSWRTRGSHSIPRALSPARDW